MSIQKRIIAAPSWVIPGNAAENCRFLSGRVDEVGLLFFESDACLEYGPADLPPALAALPLRWHAHLPLDLPRGDPVAAGRTAVALMDKVKFLGVERAVLHPPLPDCAEEENVKIMTEFINVWLDSGRQASSLLLENTPHTGPEATLRLAEHFYTAICFDFGHFFLHNSIEKKVSSDLPEGPPEKLPDRMFDRLGMLHLNAPWPGDTAAVAAGGRESGKHAPLTALDRREAEFAARVCRQAPLDCVFMLELFNWNDVEASRRVLEKWLDV